MEYELTSTPMPALSDQVIKWLLLLRSGQATRRDYADFMAWRDANPTHESAWQQLTHALGHSMAGRLGDTYPLGYQGSPDARPARQAVPARHGEDSPRPTRRRFPAGALALAGAAGAGALLAVRDFYPLGSITADAATATGERRLYQLTDGTELLLDARSRVNLEFTPTYRRLMLLEGAVAVSSPADPNRPFLVQTAEGVVRSCGQRYMVRQLAHRSLVVAHEGDLDIETSGGTRATIPQGAGARFDAARLGQVRDDLAAEAAWENGWIHANGRPLAEVISALRPYRHGTLRISMAAGGLPVTGMYPLDNPDATLEALERDMPITIRRLTPWFVSINVLST
ncbi:FecR domain-containing protein [Bordetella trematum]|uniref:FecR domain-containing protein n=1 Tax=Bordetella trematum TaxID=123899 RepID=UPI000D9BA3EC|nr:FecR domain-containing protein [Bordetella trematum]SPU50488.1 transmembrane sensor protein [Bordetella trematum]VDH06721.1 fec operon regulator FecR [Bordetella trematum]